MTSDERGEFAELLIQHLHSGRPFNDNQQQMLVMLGTHPDEPPSDIEAMLKKNIKRHVPRYAMTPTPDDGY